MKKEKTKKQLRFKKSFIAIIKDGASNGLTEEKIAKTLKVSYSTFRRWKKEYATNEQIITALKEGREVYHTTNIPKVENTLLKTIFGYSYVEKTTEEINSPDGVTTKIKKTSKRVTPNITAMIFFLVNRSDKWQSINKANIVFSSNEDAINKWLVEQKK